MSESNDIIDLTNSFTLEDDCDPSIIALDDTVRDETERQNDSASVMIVKPKTAADIANTKTKKDSSVGVPKKNAESSASSSLAKEKKFGGCPICWDELGKNPLASTQCGHVYCARCLRQHLKIMKTCPVCRRSLTGSNAYHPIYLNKK